MADKNDGADKSELPTPKRLRDARKKGDVAKSKDLSAGLLTLAWLVLFIAAAGWIAAALGALATDALQVATTMPFAEAAPRVAWSAGTALVKITAMTLVPVAVLATVAEFLQAGPVFTTEKLKFGLDKLNPMEGLKRMFGKDGLFELVKTLVKALLVLGVSAIVLRQAVAEGGSTIGLVGASPLAGAGTAAAAATLSLTYRLTLQLFALVVGVFLLVAVADWLWTQHSYIKKMKMSRRDIKQEYKDDEGDPQVKGVRREMHQEWANQNAMGATRGAAALLVNPTHIAVALDYDAERCPVPMIAAKGAGELAAAMRREAEAAKVPIIRDIATARRLYARGERGEIVPQDMFDAIAAIILWANKARAGDAPMWNDLDEGRPSLPALVAADLEGDAAAARDRQAPNKGIDRGVAAG